MARRRGITMHPIHACHHATERTEQPIMQAITPMRWYTDLKPVLTANKRSPMAAGPTCERPAPGELRGITVEPHPMAPSAV